MTQKYNVKLNYDKLQYKQDGVEFFGETYTTSGHKPSKDKVASNTSIPSLTNKQQVNSFIGAFNYLSKLSPRLSELAEPIREPEAILSKSFQSSNSKITKNTDKGFCIPLYSEIYSQQYQSVGRLLVSTRWTKRYHQATKLHIHQITSQLSARSDQLNQMRIATQEDDELVNMQTSNYLCLDQLYSISCIAETK